MDAALEIAAERGLKGLNMTEIAVRVGVVPSALYRHFEGREAVIDGIVDRTRRTLQANLERARHSGGNAREQLRLLLQLHLNLLRDHPAIPVVLLSEEVALGDRNRRERLGETVRLYRQAVTELAREALENEDEGRAALAAFALVGLAQATAVSALITGENSGGSGWALELWDLMVPLLFGAPSGA
ncbi:MAG: TetR/AcrR family transcriptional regulator [Synergistales bacterium]|nr:TetR/AcrR family transcriptional regulator [Synergistales bacterium]